MLKPETINYRTQKPEKSGLFAEEIFGPTKDWECYCGKYRKIRYKGITCDKCGVEVTHSLVRRERMGHIDLAAPVAHIWFLRSIPSKIGTVLDMSVQSLEKVIYFASFIITSVDEDLKAQTIDQLRNEYKSKRKQIKKSGAEAELLEENLAELEEDFTSMEKEIKDIVPMHILGENEYQEISLRFGHFFEAAIGGEAIRNLLRDIDLKKTIDQLQKDLAKSKGAKRERMMRRLKLLKSLQLNGIRPEWMVLTAIPIIPPDLRPMVALDGGRFATSDLNDLYRRVINRNNRLKRLASLNAPEVIIRNEKRMLQEAADAMIDNNARRTKTVQSPAGKKRQLRSLADILKGKQGRFRQNLLGKRVDYSGRSVIVVGPNLKINECGLPKKMALELFRPMVMSQVIKREFAHNVRSASRFVESERDEVWDILEEVIAETRVLLNRAPTLHRLGIQAFKPRLIEGKAIRLHPLVCTAFNADFDGDQMAVHVPLTTDARWEAENLMASEKNLLKPATGDPVVTPKQDLALGAFYVTQIVEPEDGKRLKMFNSPKEAQLAYKLRKIGLQEKVSVRFTDLSKFEKGQDARIETTVGRIMFNKLFPEKLPYYNETIISKKLGKIIRLMLEYYGTEETAFVMDAIKNLGFKYVTKSGYSLGMGDFPKLDDKPAVIEAADAQVQEVMGQYEEGLLTDTERHVKVIEIWSEAKDKIMAMNKPALSKFGPVFAMIDSGARGSWGQLTQVIGMKGLVSSPSGDIIELPVKGSFKQGFDVLEFFISSHGTRKGLSDTALRTANAGYLTRRLVDVAQDVVVREENCGEKEGILITKKESAEMGETVAARVVGRYAINDIKAGRKKLVSAGEIITEAAARLIEQADLDEVQVRSVLRCKMPKGVCQMCYGFDLGHNDLVKMGTAVGIIAAQSIGEPGTQLTMRTFHTGGVAGTDITKGLPRVEELFEARNPKRKAMIAEFAGTAHIEDAEGKVVESSTGRKIFEGRKGQKIVKIVGDPIEPEKINFDEGDEVKVEDGAEVKAGDTIIVRGSGTKEKSIYAGVAKVAKKSLKIIPEGAQAKEYIIPIGYKIYVKEGQHLEAGDALTEGHIELKELFALKGREAVQDYILKEIQDIYSSQGQKLNDKHVEVIVRQMFSRVYVEDAGDTDLLPGEVVEKAQFVEANAKLKKGAKKSQAREMFLGISKVSLSTQSFLSSASFQETAKVLINAAVTGKIDYLDGLKENVIIGRQIPAGTGYSDKVK